MAVALVETPPPPRSRAAGSEQAGFGEASGAEQDQYAFPLEVAVLPAGGSTTEDLSPHPEAHQPQPLAVTSPPGFQLCSRLSWAALSLPAI